MPWTGKELFVVWRGTFGKCKSGVIWGAVPFVLCVLFISRGIIPLLMK